MNPSTITGLFAAAARVSFAKVFPGHEGKVLSVAVGLFLAAGLAMAQRKLGFSTASLGPVAVLILCGILFLASYKFIQHSEVSKPVAVLLSALVALALARAAMPEATAAFARKNPLVILLILVGLVYWAWHSSQGFAEKISRRRPGPLLARQHAVPDERTLKNEARFVKKKVKSTTKKDRREEKDVSSELEQVLHILDREGQTPRNRAKLLDLLSKAEKTTDNVRQRSEKLVRLDQTLRDFDFRWLKRGHGIDFGHLTPEQQNVLRESLLEERKRIKVEEELEKLELAVDLHVRAMEQYIRTAKEALEGGNAAAATGWISKAIEEEKKAEELEGKILGWEKRLLKLVKRQLKECSADA